MEPAELCRIYLNCPPPPPCSVLKKVQELTWNSRIFLPNTDARIQIDFKYMGQNTFLICVSNDTKLDSRTLFIVVKLII